MLMWTQCCLGNSERKSPTTFPVCLQLICQEYGAEYELTFAGSPLNRVSFLRTDHAFLTAALKHSSTSFLLFNNLAPLAKDPTKLHYASFQDVQPLIGEDPYTKSEADLIAEYNSTITIPQLLFLGLDERQKSAFEGTI